MHDNLNWLLVIKNKVEPYNPPRTPPGRGIVNFYDKNFRRIRQEPQLKSG